jgi:hypothetical protein
MSATREDPPPTTVISGTTMRLGEHHCVAIYVKDGVPWVAEFGAGPDQLSDAACWFRAVPGALATQHGRLAALATQAPLTPALRRRILALHLEIEHGRAAGKIEAACAVARQGCRAIARSMRDPKSLPLHRP